MRFRIHKCGYSTKEQISHYFGEDNTYKTRTLAKPRFKRKGTTTKTVDSAIHKDQDNISSFNNSLQKDSKLMEQMKPVKKSKTNGTQNQAKNVTHRSQASKPDGTKKDGIKGN